ncbi:kinase-like protein, partial [Suillus decipiens]
RELGTWKRLVHPNILPLLGIARGFSPYISMVSPWYENGSLAAYLRKHEGIILSERLRLLSHVAAGLRFLHSNSIIHGNLSSNNVLIDNRHIVRLADYGLSSIVSACGELFQSHHCGALRWMAPELINDDQELGNVSSCYSDIYSFGCIMLHVR